MSVEDVVNRIDEVMVEVISLENYVDSEDEETLMEVYNILKIVESMVREDRK